MIPALIKLYQLIDKIKMSGRIAHKAFSKGAQKKFLKKHRPDTNWDNPSIWKDRIPYSTKELEMIKAAKTAAKNAAGYGAGIGGGLGILDYATSEKIRSEFNTDEEYEAYLESLE